MNKKTCYIIFILIGIAVILWRCSCGFWNDDWVYNQNIDVSGYDDVLEADLSFWSNSHPQIENPWQAFRSMYNHWQCVNGRTIHVLTFMSYLLPQWLVMALNGAMVMWLILLVLQMCNAGTRSPLLMTICVASFFVVLPWHDHLAASVFCMNYVWVSVFLLLIIREYSRWTFDNPPSWRRVIWFSGLCLIVGSMHEGMCISVLCGMTYVLIYSMIKRRGRVPFRYWLPGLLFAAGAAVCMFSPGNMRLLAEREAYIALTSSYARYIFGIQFWPMWLALATMLIINARKGRNALLSAIKENLFWIVIALVTCIIGGRQQGSGRYYWLMYLSAIIIFWKSVYATRLPERLSGIKSLICAGVATCGILFWLGTLTYWQNRYTQEQLMVREMLLQSKREGKPTHIFYADMLHRGSAPWWLMNSYDCLNDIDEIEMQNLYTSIYHKFENIAILPTKYKGLPLDSLPLVPGTAGMRGEYLTYYSPKNLDGKGLYATFGLPGHYETLGSVNRVYILPRLREGATTAGSIYSYSIHEVRSPGDTLYLYHLSGLGRAVYSLPILRLDTIP